MSEFRTERGKLLALGTFAFLCVVGLLALSAKVSRVSTVSPPPALSSATAETTRKSGMPATDRASKASVPAGTRIAGGTIRAAERPPEELRADTKAIIAALRSDGLHLKATWHALHFKPDIDTATNEQCLACHKEILEVKPRKTSPAGLSSDAAIAWYQTLDTYEGDQLSFHARHLTSQFSKQVMNLSCNFCHQGHDPREEAPGASATSAPASFSLRKVVNPTETCLLCHGKFPHEVMELPGPWHESRESFESPDAPNGCLTCHEEQFRTNRHNVSYLNAAEIEALAKTGSSDSCFGCHGGRAWYRNSYPYPRTPWPGMDSKIPDWAKSRPTSSNPRYSTSK
mgnify:CR=1 FL=1